MFAELIRTVGARRYMPARVSELRMKDPYRKCPEFCRHDLGRGVTLSELRTEHPNDRQVVYDAR